MTVDLVPGLASGLGLGLGLLLLPALILLSHPPLRIASLTARFAAAAGLALALFAAGIVLAALAGHSPAWADLLAGAMILAGAILSAFTLWTLVCWGFTTSLLLALARSGPAESHENWFREYAGGGYRMFTQDRLGLLLRAGLVREAAGTVRLTGGRARAFARLADLLRRFYGLAQPQPHAPASVGEPPRHD
ncbi:hypothetical protein [Mangrovibrevibacter kandeliae]|uniref:hypothetical protein n=1 Tax=Mangrovibrevibacter kandeliae TaxID=2968473 RepID=UPI00211963FE|nr:hypothetical protein [Aurantimonas sp. CSK15Z-1]MCQ8782843.1 hypothetical protein [Aurantimonas sp. CSK15Z-1]